MFAIENFATRKSLKNVFDNIFAKYGRDFQEADEIDLETLNVIKSGGHLRSSRILSFGSVFKHRRRAVVDPSPSDEESAEEDLGPTGCDPFANDGLDIFESQMLLKRPSSIEDRQSTAQLQSSFQKAVARDAGMSSGGVPARGGEPPKTFDETLLVILRGTVEARKERLRCRRAPRGTHRANKAAAAPSDLYTKGRFDQVLVALIEGQLDQCPYAV